MKDKWKAKKCCECGSEEIVFRYARKSYCRKCAKKTEWYGFWYG